MNYVKMLFVRLFKPTPQYHKVSGSLLRSAGAGMTGDVVMKLI